MYPSELATTIGHWNTLTSLAHWCWAWKVDPLQGSQASLCSILRTPHGIVRPCNRLIRTLISVRCLSRGARWSNPLFDRYILSCISFCRGIQASTFGSWKEAPPSSCWRRGSHRSTSHRSEFLAPTSLRSCCGPFTRSSLGRDTRASRRKYRPSLPLWGSWRDRNQWFWCILCDPGEYFQVWDLCGWSL